jgi:toxin ParE1/3/4
MGWEIDFSPQALDDLAEAVRYIAEDNPQAAERVGNALIDRVLVLKEFQELGRPYPKRQGIRTLVCGTYLIFYRVIEKEERIEILRYWHAARGDAQFE